MKPTDTGCDHFSGRNQTTSSTCSSARTRRGRTWAAPESWKAGRRGYLDKARPASGVGTGHHRHRDVGQPNTWLVGTDSALWKTTDAGKNWHQLSNTGSARRRSVLLLEDRLHLHGWDAVRAVRTSAELLGRLGRTSLTRRTTPVYGDGDFLYTQISFTGTNARNAQPYLYSQESNGLAGSNSINRRRPIDSPEVRRCKRDGSYSANWKAVSGR